MISKYLIYIHVIFGFAGLAAFWVPVFSKKGRARHVKFGRIYVWCAYIALAAAAVVLTFRYTAWFQAGTGPSDIPFYFSFYLFLGYLVFNVYVSVYHGSAVMLHKHHEDWNGMGLHQGLALLSVISSLALIAYAVVYPGGNRVLLFMLSPLGLSNGYGMWRYMKDKSNSSRHAYVIEHMGAMLGSGIGFHTAFGVFGLTRLLDHGFSGWLQFLPWILPAGIGIPSIIIWSRYYRKKYGIEG